MPVDLSADFGIMELGRCVAAARFSDINRVNKAAISGGLVLSERSSRGESATTKSPLFIGRSGHDAILDSASGRPSGAAKFGSDLGFGWNAIHTGSQDALCGRLTLKRKGYSLLLNGDSFLGNGPVVDLAIEHTSEWFPSLGYPKNKKYPVSTSVTQSKSTNGRVRLQGENPRQAALKVFTVARPSTGVFNLCTNCRACPHDSSVLF